MKKLIIWILLTLILSCAKSQQDNKEVDMHNSRNSLDWTGIYSGTLFYTDSLTVQIKLQLSDEENYKIEYFFPAKESGIIIDSGKFNWDSTGISFHINDLKFSFKVIENELEFISGTATSFASYEMKLIQRLKKMGPIFSKKWYLLKIANTDAPTESVTPNKPYFILESFPSSVSGYNGCNRFFGSYKISDMEMIFSSLGSTRMACVDFHNENEINDLFNNVQYYGFENDKLLFLDESGTKLAEWRLENE
jgi:copper homeostasis protein (lipoprotein)